MEKKNTEIAKLFKALDALDKANEESLLSGCNGVYNYGDIRTRFMKELLLLGGRPSLREV